MDERILRDTRDGLCTLTINRPDKLNALDGAFFDAMHGALDALAAESDDIGCVVLRGAGRAFCAGVDLGEIAAGSRDPAFRDGVIEKLRMLPQPVIVAVSGACYTGGLELALTGDFIVADTTARFADTHAKWGLVAGWGMTELLHRRVGLAAAKRMTMTAMTVPAEEALAMGLVDILTPAGGLDAAVEDFARAILANSRWSNTEHKRILRETEGLPVMEALRLGKQLHRGRAPDYQERVAGFNARK